MSKPRKFSFARSVSRRVLRLVSVLLFIVAGVFSAHGQYYSWGGDPLKVRWRKIKTDDVKLIYPDYYEENARRAMWYLDTIRPYIGRDYRHGTMRTPVILHTQNTSGNGSVMWAPKRIDLMAAPDAPYSEPWLKQLVIHEYRHNVQYNNLRRSTNRVLTWILGEQVAFLGPGQFSIAILEGDATMAETEMSAFGRGLQPSFTMHYRALAGEDPAPKRDSTGRRIRQRWPVGHKKYASDYWFSGSYRDFVPDHYRLGYQMVRWSYDHWGKSIWDDVAGYVARNPQWIVPMIPALKKYYDTGTTKIFKDSFADLNAHWDSLPRVDDSARRIATPETSYTTYQSPLWLSDSTLIAFKSDLDRAGRIVNVDVATGREKVLAGIGSVSSRPVMAGGRLWWTEYRSSLLWEQKVSSRLVSYDFAADRKRVHRIKARRDGPRGSVGGAAQVLYPVFAGGYLAYVEYDYTGRFSIVRRSGDEVGGGEEDLRLDFPLSVEVCGLAWDEVTARLYFIGLDDGGMFLGAVTEGGDTGDSEVSAAGYERLTPARHITISDLRAADGKLYFGSIVSGKDEAHLYDPAAGTEYRLSESSFGAFQPAPSADGERVALTTYDRNGYHLAVQDVAGAVPQEQRELPVDLVNPKWKRWSVDIPRMDSLVYTPEAAKASKATHKSRRFLKMFKLFKPHSWLPINFYPPGAIQEMDLTVSLGATVISQNLLSDMTSWLAYGWSRRGSHLLRGGLSYSGLGPVVGFEFVWSKAYYSVAPSIYLPMRISSGAWIGSLAPQVSYMYANTLGHGVDKLNFYLTYSGQTRMAQKEFLPRWGITLRAGYVMNPRLNLTYRSQYSAYVQAYLPGVVRPHSTRLRFSWQETVGTGSRVFIGKELFPRGARYDFATRRWASASIDYQLPVWYPEAGIPRFIYFKRVRVNVFADYARWQDFSGRGEGLDDGGKWRPVFSYGGDIILDLSPLRMPATSTFSLRLTLAKPSDRRGVWFGFGMEMPL